MRSIRSRLVKLTEGMFCLGMLMMAVPVLVGMQCYTVISGSMEPKIPKGAVIYVKKIPFSKIRPKDVITYRIGEKGGTVTHRVVRIDKDKKVLFTKGDRNEIQDACPVKEGQIQGIVKGCIPVVGYGILFFKAKYRMVILIVLLGTAEGICLLMERKEEQKHKC
nr:signal peptidase I [uncultured Blautia sp.]